MLPALQQYQLFELQLAMFLIASCAEWYLPMQAGSCLVLQLYLLLALLLFVAQPSSFLFKHWGLGPSAELM